MSALNNALPKLPFPENEEECTRRTLIFQQSRNSPISGIIVALVVLAIDIMRPLARCTPDAKKYFNGKEFCSLCVQAAVGADHKFYFVFARHAGGTLDSTALEATELYHLLQSTVL